MSNHQLIRWGGLAAILAGALRTATAFWPSTEPGPGLEVVYLVIDVLILLGVLGIYAFQSHCLGWIGLLGFLLALIGTAIITGPDGYIGQVNMYAAGSLSIGIGLVLLAIGSWTSRTLPPWIGILWVLSTATGIVAAATTLQALFVVSGVAFGLGFIGAGATVWTRVRRSSLHPPAF